MCLFIVWYAHCVQQTLQFTPLVLQLSLVRSHLLWGEFSIILQLLCNETQQNSRTLHYIQITERVFNHIGAFTQHKFPKLVLRGDEVSMLTHTYTRKFIRKIKWSSAVTRLTAHCTCGLIFALVVFKPLIEMSMVVHDIEHPYWDRMSLNDTTPKLVLFISASTLIVRMILSAAVSSSFYICFLKLTVLYLYVF